MAQADFATALFDMRLGVERIALALLELRRDLLARGSRTPVASKYNPDQPRVPAGNPDGGQWTSGGGEGSAGEDSLSSDLERALDGLDKDSLDWATGRSRGGAGAWPNATPAQQARLVASELQAQAAIRRVQEIDARWKPPASISEGIEGAIATNQAAVRQAEARLRELQGMGIGPGPFAEESIPSRGPSRRFTAEERQEINRLGYTYGCHTCGTTEPGLPSRNFIPDHQIPNALSPKGSGQRLYPHCRSCSDAQGGNIRAIQRRR
ncbi:conserved hypothetical protein [Bosea sp. 62]|nr:conserved hypothetical protein [Bosea sp. 7B]CAD5277760.1 conserved hypothetical protein [Bosea sp. 21B]CAD5278776.1 conserved hypothetical protein [Bosea sp. 46]VVT59734.1 conserved hypothetical protein [Bosea sp. EC-HK365B]VXB41360.1 conserved hypothetical protein [Bosea sp. 62]VXC02566.1 conserved hypothetical protein [Bosea sp. 127]VXC27476.1 conserved hypothetical protein [Bosea sp. 29B]VXC77493.1 conserved hypothetical protein [Bosea sp. 125]